MAKKKSNLIKARERIGLSIEDVSRTINIGKSTLYRYEAGYPIPSDILLNLSGLYKCDPCYLLGCIDDFNHEIADIHEATGLSEKAIKKLHDTDYSSILSLLIEDINYEYLLSLISKRIKNYDPKAFKKRSPKELMEDDLWIDLDGQRVLTYKRNMLDSLIQSEITSMIHVIAEDYHRKSK